MVSNFMIAMYEIFYALRKIKAHLKELDQLVTQRFSEVQEAKIRL